jgi:hypothetical protein
LEAYAIAGWVSRRQAGMAIILSHVLEDVPPAPLTLILN